MAYEPQSLERKIVEGCKKGEAAQQKKLFELFYGKMLGVCQRYATNREEAKDIVQDGYIKVFQHIEEFSFSSPLEAWIRRIMINTAIDRYRKNLTIPPVMDIEAVTSYAGEENIISNLNHSDMLSLIQSLPTGYKMVFNMYVIEGFSHKEIAETLNINEGTSKSQLSKARMYLQKQLEILNQENER